MAGGRTAIVKALLGAGADVEVRDEKGRTPLHYGAVVGREVVIALLDAGVNVNVREKDGVTPLHVAVSADVATALIAAGATVNARSREGTTPLHHAATRPDPATLAALIAAGADVNAARRDGTTPLHLAAEEGRSEPLTLLLEAGAQVNVRDGDGKTPWDLAELRGEDDDDFLYSDGYWKLHEASLIGGGSDALWDDDSEDHLEEGPDELSAYLETVAASAPASPATQPRPTEEKQSGMNWLLTALAAIFSVFMVLLDWSTDE